MVADPELFHFSSWTLKILNCLMLPEVSYEEITSVKEAVSAIKESKVR